MNLEFNGKIIFWRGPAPWYFVAVPQEQSLDIQAISSFVTYGRGVIPVQVIIGETPLEDLPVPQRRRLPRACQIRRAQIGKPG